MTDNDKKSRFSELVASFAAPLISVALMMLASAYFTTFISLFLDHEGVGKTKIGLIQSAFYFGMLTGAFRMEKLIRRTGHIQALAIFGSLATSTILVQFAFENFIVWTIMRFLNGISLAAIYIVIESWMLTTSENNTRGVILSLYMIVLYVSQALSQQILNFIDLTSFTPFILSAILTSLGVIPVCLSTTRITLPEIESIRFKKILKASPFGVMGCLASGLILSSLYSFFPIYAVSKSFSGENLMSVLIAGGVALQWPLGKLSDYFERRLTLLSIVGTTLALSLLILFYPGNHALIMYTLAFFIGGCVFTIYPVSVTQVCDHLDYSQITKATALLLIVHGAGSSGGPIASSSVVGYFGTNSLFSFITVTLFLLLVLGIAVIFSRKIVPYDEQRDFVPTPGVTPVASELDPRTDEETENKS